jgi:hypothetical protein
MTFIPMEFEHPILSLNTKVVGPPTLIAVIFIELVIDAPLIFEELENVHALLENGDDNVEAIVATVPYTISYLPVKLLNVNEDGIALIWGKAFIATVI